MQRGWWLVRWLGTGMAILSLLTHSWGQDTEGMSSQHRGDHPQASPDSVNRSYAAKKETCKVEKAMFFLFLLLFCQVASMVEKFLYNTTRLLLLILNSVPV